MATVIVVVGISNGGVTHTCTECGHWGAIPTWIPNNSRCPLWWEILAGVAMAYELHRLF